MGGGGGLGLGPPMEPQSELFKFVKLDAPEDDAGNATNGDVVAATGGDESFGETITFGDHTLCLGDIVVATETFRPELKHGNNPVRKDKEYAVVMVTAVEAQENDRVLIETTDLEKATDWVEKANGIVQYWLKKHELEKVRPKSSGGYPEQATEHPEPPVSAPTSLTIGIRSHPDGSRLGGLCYK